MSLQFSLLYLHVKHQRCFHSEMYITPYPPAVLIQKFSNGPSDTTIYVKFIIMDIIVDNLLEKSIR